MNISTIIRTDIKTNDIVKVLVNEDGIEEYLYGVVAMNTGNTLGVRYLCPIEATYKSATIYELEADDGEMNPVPYESLSEHYPSGTTFNDLEFRCIDNNLRLYAPLSEIDIEDEDETIHLHDDNDSDSDTGSEFDDFIVPDNEIDGIVCPPPGHETIDKDWNNWNPTSPGARSFKSTVDAIEMHARLHADNLNWQRASSA